MGYAITDHLGSIWALVNEQGGFIEKYAYDPWGRRVNPDDWSLVDNRTTFVTDRGFTLHEHYDAMQIINMVARLYDPLTGQFISVDPMADKYPGLSAYVYCANNPLEYTDPTGESWSDVQSYTEWIDSQDLSTMNKDDYAYYYDLYVIDNTLFDDETSSELLKDLAFLFRMDKTFVRGNGEWIFGLSGMGDVASSSGDGQPNDGLKLVRSEVYIYDGTGDQHDGNFKVEAGNHIIVELVNKNVLGVNLIVEDQSTYYYERSWLGLPRKEYSGSKYVGNLNILRPSARLEFSRFAVEPYVWLINISPHLSDAANVQVNIYSNKYHKD